MYNTRISFAAHSRAHLVSINQSRSIGNTFTLKGPANAFILYTNSLTFTKTSFICASSCMYMYIHNFSWCMREMMKTRESVNRQNGYAAYTYISLNICM